MSGQEISTRYDASLVERKWYSAWEEAGCFRPGEANGRPTYSITIPPPNVTGSLHMGHALCYGLQDMLARFKRLTGHRVLVLPGQDHAGIATQSVVEKLLRSEGTSGAEIGREKFLERAWQWRRESGDTILSQFRRLGCSFDWSRESFTLDDHYADAVLQVFVDWFDRGLIYRGLRVVNWDPVLKTSVSDIETERKVVKGKLYRVRYPFSDGSGHIVVATTRPETMLGDVAVAVNPSDARYSGKVGKTLTLPLVGREIPLVADHHPDPEFGTGAVKVTPGHDADDFEIGQRHSLETLIVLDERARVVEGYGSYSGLDRSEARKRIVTDLERQGFLEGEDPHEIALVVSSRSGEATEPLASEQWFVRQAELAGPAIEAVRSGQIRFVPERFTNIYLDWLENIRDWCVSRQLWWGHQVPVYYAEDGSTIAATSWEEAEAKSGKKIVRQDSDVLDTWFSSGLWPFATLGWPQQTDDLSEFYPTSVLVTARDIIYLWVARMAMAALDKTGQVPFHEVYVYATVLTEDGKRMSKSLGTGVDPMQVIEEKGADALRFTLFSQTGENQDIRYSERRTVDARNFANKVWNASRFVMQSLDGFEGELTAELGEMDRWLLSRLTATAREARAAFEGYDPQAACAALYRFFWSEMCDWYIEVSKGRLADESSRNAPQWILETSLRAFLTMLHPVMPHLTEEVNSLLPRSKGMVATSTWPETPEEWLDEALETRVERWLDAVRTVRAMRADMQVTPGKRLPEIYFEGDLDGGETVLASQAWFETAVQGKPEGKFVSSTSSGTDFHLLVGDLVNNEQEAERLTKRLEALSQEARKLEARLSQPDFAARAKPEIVERERETLAERKAEIEKVRTWLEVFSS
ncbi:MAG: valine--tRNA ligase [Fimbriimonadaceae bacterium]